MNLKEEKVELIRCNLCKKYYDESEMSEEHYPARSVGNQDIVKFDILKMFEMFEFKEGYDEISDIMNDKVSLEKSAEEIFDTKLSESLYPNGRTSRTLCINCNTFLGKYDEAYLKFFEKDGDSTIINGFQINTKYRIIKSIYAKFLSISEAINEDFDFHDFVKDEKLHHYSGKWRLYFVKRDFNTDFLGFNDLGTGSETYNEGVVYELSDNKFIFNLMNFEKHKCFEMTNIFEILNKDYKLVVGVGKDGGYHSQILMSRLLSESDH